jgi:hypothetical protein
LAKSPENRWKAYLGRSVAVVDVGGDSGSEPDVVETEVRHERVQLEEKGERLMRKSRVRTISTRGGARKAGRTCPIPPDHSQQIEVSSSRFERELREE